MLTTEKIAPQIINKLPQWPSKTLQKPMLHSILTYLLVPASDE